MNNLSLRFISLIFILFTCSTTAQTTYTWNGGSGDWNVATNWTPVGVPGAGDKAVITSGDVTLTTDVTIADIDLSGTLSGDSNFLVTNLMTWNGGVMQGNGVTTIDVGATMQLSGTNQQTLRRDLENNGTTIWEAGQFALFNAAPFNNNGIFLDQHSSTQLLDGGIYGCVFNNNGTYTKNSSGLSKLNLPFYNIGSLDLQVGNLELNGEGTSDGSINIDDGFLLKIQGSPQWDINGPISGAGRVEFWTKTIIRGIYNITGNTFFASNTTTFDTSATIVSMNNGQELVMSGVVEFNTDDDIYIDSLYLSGTLRGSDAVTIVGAMNWASGEMQGTGVTTIDAGATLRLSGGNQQTLRRDLESNGTTIWEAGQFALFNGVAFNNNGSFLDQHPSSQQLSGGAYGCFFNNNGTYTKNSSGQSDIQLPFYNIPSSEIRGTGTLRIFGSFTNEGTVSPGETIGTLMLETDYPTAASSSLNIEIGGSPTSLQYDKLQIIGAATLDGNLNISLVNNFVPAIGDTFEVLTCSSHTGNFSAINGLNTGTGISFDTVFTSTALLLVTITTSDIEESFNSIPKACALAQNYPNPFNPSTKIKFGIPSGVKSQTLNVSLIVYDMIGNEVATLVSEQLPAGEYEVEFSGHSEEGQNLSSGIYFYQIQAGEFVQTKKMVLMK